MTKRAPIAIDVPDASQRRACLFALALSISVPTSALALDLTLPKFEDLRPKWASVEMGHTSAVVVQLMGDPNSRTESVTAGVERLELQWKDIKGNHYTAKFLAGRLYAKQITDNR